MSHAHAHAHVHAHAHAHVHAHAHAHVMNVCTMLYRRLQTLSTVGYTPIMGGRSRVCAPRLVELVMQIACAHATHPL